MAKKKEEEKKKTSFSPTRLVNAIKKDYVSVDLASNIKDPTEYISTGNLAVDLALNGGILFGYITEWAGLSQSGKSLFLQLMLADAQKKYGAFGIWLDRENAWTNERADELGIDTTNMIKFGPADIPTVRHAEQALEDTLSKIPDDVHKFVAIDSISAFVKEGKISKEDMGKTAKTIHTLFRRITSYMNPKLNTLSLHYANHVTYKVGEMFGNPETTGGGEATKYYPNYRLKLDNSGYIINKDENETVGHWINVVILKTRQGPSRRKVVLPFYYVEGIPYYGGYARVLVDRNYLKPKNKKEFASKKQVTVSYTDSSGEEHDFSEHDIERFASKYPDLIFDTWPKFKKDVEEKEVTEKEE